MTGPKDAVDRQAGMDDGDLCVPSIVATLIHEGILSAMDGGKLTRKSSTGASHEISAQSKDIHTDIHITGDRKGNRHVRIDGRPCRGITATQWYATAASAR
jgi:hypothetical protein